MKHWFRKVGIIGLIVSLITGILGGIHTQAQEKPFDGKKVTVGLVPGASEEVWNVAKELAAKDGIDIEFVFFNDYVQPNQALKDGSIDLNAFQHIAYLDNWNKENNADLTQIGYTFVSPMGAYSKNYKSLDELKDGDTVAVPNDPTNGGRAILALQIAGHIKVDPKAGILPTPNDITENPKNLKFKELDAAQLAASLPDVAVAFINNNFATDAGLSLKKDAIFIDADHPEKLNEAYRNVVVARKEDKDNPLYLQIVKYYNTQEVADAIFKYAGGDKPGWIDAPTKPSNEQ